LTLKYARPFDYLLDTSFTNVSGTEVVETSPYGASEGAKVTAIVLQAGFSTP
jgi:hypothetical protein